MTIDWSALHDAIVADLDSDEPRLVLADALQVVGDPRDLVGGTGLGSLTHLSLQACSLDDNALDYLLRSPLGHRLQYLNLSSNPLTERSLDGLAELRSLRRLRLEHVPINKDALAPLRARWPNTEILA